VALSRTAPPADPTGASAVVDLLGHAPPPPLTLGRLLTQGYPDVLALAVAVAAVVTYAQGLLVLRRHGQVWATWRTAAWLAGCGMLVVLTSGGPGVYADVSLAVHVAQHLGLLVVVPALWVLGAPVTLALRTLPARGDGSFGPRETLLALLASRARMFVTDPVTAAGLLAAVVIFSYFYTGIVEVALFEHAAHVTMNALFLGVGCLFAWVVAGLSPEAGLPAVIRSLRQVTLAVAAACLAFFGFALSSSRTVLAADWWAALSLTDQTALLRDQHNAAVVAWVGALLLVVPGLLLIRDPRPVPPGAAVDQKRPALRSVST
jgi:cytochrome c oxidase assembly factor CtaG